MKTFYSEFIDHERNRKGMSLTDLSKKSGVPFSTVQKIVSKGCVPRIDTMERILDALDYELVFWTRSTENFEK